VNTFLIIFVAVAAVAILIQAVILFLIYRSTNRASARMEGIAARIEERSTPVLITAYAILTDAQPKIRDITSNLAEATAVVRANVTQIGEATAEIVERARMQAVRVDELISGTVNRIEDTAEMVQNTVVHPVRKIQAILQALQAGIGFLRQGRSRGRRDGTTGQAVDGDEEEMFI
jgi:methyl-accepting chemotaxis protein